MKRIILHWTAGAHAANAVDRRAYHFLIEGSGAVVPGEFAPEANRDTSDGRYAAHTRALNTGSVGVALCAMHGATERPFDPGSYPITAAQIDALAVLCADLCTTYAIPVARETVLTHAEVQRTLGVKQRAKWDIRWLPGMPAPGGALAVGDRLRGLIRDEVAGAAPQPAAPVSPPTKPGPFTSLLAALAALFGKDTT